MLTFCLYIAVIQKNTLSLQMSISKQKLNSKNETEKESCCHVDYDDDSNDF